MAVVVVDNALLVRRREIRKTRGEERREEKRRGEERREVRNCRKKRSTAVGKICAFRDKAVSASIRDTRISRFQPFIEQTDFLHLPRSACFVSSSSSSSPFSSFFPPLSLLGKLWNEAFRKFVRLK